ncbi:MAG: NADH-quinone oxidoreductase subunit [Mucilaginibacter sp.]|nr:NADH-quinone oxidoreductase subunit [Mucilaginibacter sp.]
MVGFAFFVTRILAPNNPNPEKLTSYECGEDPVGSAWIPFNTRFYVIALIFLLFDVEMVFILPWATVFGNHDISNFDKRWGWLSLTEMFIFLGILILGLVYVWVKGDLNWIKSKPIIPTVNTQVPSSLYEKLNLQQSSFMVKPFTLETKPELTATGSPAAANPAPIRKPMFKPTFKKPANES